MLKELTVVLDYYDAKGTYSRIGLSWTYFHHLFRLVLCGGADGKLILLKRKSSHFSKIIQSSRSNTNSTVLHKAPAIEQGITLVRWSPRDSMCAWLTRKGGLRVLNVLTMVKITFFEMPKNSTSGSCGFSLVWISENEILTACDLTIYKLRIVKDDSNVTFAEVTQTFTLPELSLSFSSETSIVGLCSLDAAGELISVLCTKTNEKNEEIKVVHIIFSSSALEVRRKKNILL
jgi:hypothetical protein